MNQAYSDNNGHILSKRAKPSPFSLKVSSSELTSLHLFFQAIFRVFGHSLLVFGFGLWLICPIIGIFPILIYTQTSLSSHFLKSGKIKVNFSILVLVLFTLTVFNAAIDSFSDTDTYLDIYKNLIDQPFFEYLSQRDIEPVSFVIPKFIGTATEGNELWFLFSQSFIMNLAFTGYSVLLLPEIYPLIIFLNISSPTYYDQLFIMRQIYSLVFLIPAIQTQKVSLRILLLAFAYYTHSSSVILIAPLLLLDLLRSQSLRKVFSLLKRRVVILMIFAIIVFLYPVYVTSLAALLSYISQLTGNATLAIRVDRWLDHVFFRSSLIWYLGSVLNSLLIILVLIRTEIRTRCNRYYYWLICSLVMISILSLSLFIGVTDRFLWFYTALPGFFMFSVFLSGKFSSKIVNYFTYLLVAVTVLRFGLFFYRIVRFQNERDDLIGRSVTFWNGYPLDANVIDYFEFLSGLLFSF